MRRGLRSSLHTPADFAPRALFSAPHHRGRTPLDGIYAAVTRRTLDDRNPIGWVPEQKIAVEQALRAYTTGSAFAGFQEQAVGMIRAGMLADLVMIDQDITRLKPESIRDARVMLTMVGGRVVFDRDGMAH